MNLPRIDEIAKLGFFSPKTDVPERDTKLSQNSLNIAGAFLVTGATRRFYVGYFG